MKRYKQQMLLPEIGTGGQKQLDKTSVLVVGAGGLGTVVATYLSIMGVGKVGVVDFDEVDETNLHRQFFYSSEDIGHKKTKVLATKLKKQNNSIEVIPIIERIDNLNFERIASGYKIICDCSDNLATRLILDNQCKLFKLPLLHGAVSDWQGYLTIFHYKNQFQYHDLFDIKTLLKNDSCESNGILSPICGIIGSMMANEAVKIILDLDSSLDGGLLYFNGLNSNSKLLKLKKQTS